MNYFISLKRYIPLRGDIFIIMKHIKHCQHSDQVCFSCLKKFMILLLDTFREFPKNFQVCIHDVDNKCLLTSVINNLQKVWEGMNAVNVYDQQYSSSITTPPPTTLVSHSLTTIVTSMSSRKLPKVSLYTEKQFSEKLNKLTGIIPRKILCAIHHQASQRNYKFLVDESYLRLCFTIPGNHRFNDVILQVCYVYFDKVKQYYTHNLMCRLRFRRKYTPYECSRSIIEEEEEKEYTTFKKKKRRI